MNDSPRFTLQKSFLSPSRALLHEKLRPSQVRLLLCKHSKGVADALLLALTLPPLPLCQEKQNTEDFQGRALFLVQAQNIDNIAVSNQVASCWRKH